jgi:hypothetical protein
MGQLESRLQNGRGSSSAAAIVTAAASQLLVLAAAAAAAAPKVAGQQHDGRGLHTHLEALPQHLQMVSASIDALLLAL